MLNRWSECRIKFVESPHENHLVTKLKQLTTNSQLQKLPVAKQIQSLLPTRLKPRNQIVVIAHLTCCACILGEDGTVLVSAFGYMT